MQSNKDLLGIPKRVDTPSILRCIGGNGMSTVSNRRRWGTFYNQGSAFSYTDDATNGTRIYINETGLYSFVGWDAAGVAGIGFGLVRWKSTPTTTAISSITTPDEILCMASIYIASATSRVPYGTTEYLEAGDMVQLVTDNSSLSAGNQVDRASLICKKIG